MPNMLIAAPGDPMETRACLRYLVENPQPSYLRLGKAGEPNFHSEVPVIEPGKWLNVTSGEANKCFICTGATLSLANDWINAGEYKNFSIYSLPLWGMKYKKQQLDQIENISKLVTIEDHLTDGGFGSWILESLYSKLDQNRFNIEIKALTNNVCGQVGTQAYLNKLGKISL
jgi:transketolase